MLCAYLLVLTMVVVKIVTTFMVFLSSALSKFVFKLHTEYQVAHNTQT